MLYTIDQLYSFLKFCPECGKELEINPISSQKACFLHGDLEIRREQFVWIPLRNFARN